MLTWIRPPQTLPANWFPRAIVAGFVASVVAVIALVHMYGLAWLFARVDIIDGQGGNTVTEWLRIATNNPVADLTRGNLGISVAIHFLVGIAFAIAYAYFFRERFIGPSWRRGALFSIIPFLLQNLVVVPLLGGGVFGLSLGAGPLPMIGSFILHLVYGVTLGISYVAIGRGALEEHGMSPIDQHAQFKSQRTMALGIVGGTLLGGFIGSVLAAVPTALPSMNLGVDPWFFAIGAAAIGGAWGGLAASMWGLPSDQREEGNLEREIGGVAPPDEKWVDKPGVLEAISANKPVAFRWRGEVPNETWMAFYEEVVRKLPPNAAVNVDIRLNTVLPASEADARMGEVREGLRRLRLQDSDVEAA